MTSVSALSHTRMMDRSTNSFSVDDDDCETFESLLRCPETTADISRMENEILEVYCEQELKTVPLDIQQETMIATDEIIDLTMDTSASDDTPVAVFREKTSVSCVQENIAHPISSSYKWWVGKNSSLDLLYFFIFHLLKTEDDQQSPLSSSCRFLYHFFRNLEGLDVLLAILGHYVQSLPTNVEWTKCSKGNDKRTTAAAGKLNFTTEENMNVQHSNNIENLVHFWVNWYLEYIHQKETQL